MLLPNFSGSMGNVKSIEKAVESLHPSELAEFDAAVWGKQIERDAASGKLEELATETLADYRADSAR